jgi:hypothetical protein
MLFIAAIVLAASTSCAAETTTPGWRQAGGNAGGDAGSNGGNTGDDSDGGASPDGGSPSGDDGAAPPPGDDASAPQGTPPYGGSSGGSGGTASGGVVQVGGVTYNLIVPSSYSPSTPTPLILVYSGTEGGGTMTSNLDMLGPQTGTDGMLRAVLDGKAYYFDDGTAGAAALDDVRKKYNVDNDRTYLLGESAGTAAALALGFHKRQSYFAAYWANDVNATDTPGSDANALGFAPWGQAGPGGDFPDAQSIVNGMKAAGYRLPNPAPYQGSGSNQHGNVDQFIAAVSWFPGKTRK